MKKKENNSEVTIQEEIQSIGIDISIVASLIKFLDAGVNSELQIKKADLENLVSVINSYMQRIVEKQDILECHLEM